MSIHHPIRSDPLSDTLTPPRVDLDLGLVLVDHDGAWDTSYISTSETILFWKLYLFLCGLLAAEHLMTSLLQA